MDNGLRGRFNAWLLDLLDGYMDRKYGRVKRALFQNLPHVVVELGPGAGANMRYYPAGTRVVAVEPNARMHERLRRRARHLGVELQLDPAPAETLNLADASVDLVVVTLVLCSVSRPEAVVAEARRVLRPGGRLVCIEHVQSPPGSALRALQGVLAGPWRWVFEGCDLLNETERVLRQAGFSVVNVERLAVATVFLPIRTQIVATCVA
jgi:ubiquinone/menaquinone biosynthesis C-methylase UbiE